MPTKYDHHNMHMHTHMQGMQAEYYHHCMWEWKEECELLQNQNNLN